VLGIVNERPVAGLVGGDIGVVGTGVKLGGPVTE
tara:strand:+ start:222 stop:323 length:102 start_codon:yes stop_codon:yes gene_type:complete